ncbi:GNAT family N-acetyltransferase [Cellvibrio sp. PSBB023]|uniref:GNAT family N-acetyltransferase n=1 Tax=Cellvibrio sp. PSBB023 TaxID=1945512 RepID=UPI00098FBE49|nr:GNAT family N-acetyltransferase [Cellvibrio sp. PSBB023]AQT59672.1 hypothetical protein B0D95_05885 [Cellvibrio sp. PSBB023]
MAVHNVSVAVVADYIVCPEPAARHALVDRFYRSLGYKVKIAASESVYAVYTATSQGLPVEMVAALRLVPQASGHFWLRNLLVAKDQRGQGVATLLMQYLLPQIHPQGCYCFALPHLEQFYLRLGFSLQPKHCPADIQQKYEQYRARGRDWLLMGYITETACLIS